MEVVDDFERQLKPKPEARLATVQALFQVEQGGGSVDWVKRQFIDYRLSETADVELFEKLLTGTHGAISLVDPQIALALSDKWKLERIDATLRAILRCGVFELINAPETPAPVLLDAYVDLTAAFFDDKETAFINAVLDRLAREIRPGSLDK